MEVLREGTIKGCCFPNLQIKTVLSMAGTIFKAHSVTGVSTSAAAAGVSILEILEAADWSRR